MVRLFRADGDPQCIRKPVGIHAAHNETMLLQERIRRMGVMIGRYREVHQYEIANAGRDIETKLRELLREPRKPLIIMCNGTLDEIMILDRRNASGNRRCADVEVITTFSEVATSSIPAS